MKNCEYIKELLSWYLDNELHENQRKEVVTHLEQCNDCKLELESLKNIIESLNEMDEIDLPNDYNEKLHYRLLEENKSLNKYTWKNRTKYISYASTAVAGLILFVFAFSGGDFNRIFNKMEFAYVNDTNLGSVEIGKLKDETINKNPSLKESVTEKDENSNIGINIFDKNRELNKSDDKDQKNIQTEKPIEQITILNDSNIESNEKAASNDIDDETNPQSEAMSSLFNSDVKEPITQPTDNIAMAKFIAPEINIVDIGLQVANSSELVPKLNSTVIGLGGSVEELELMKSSDASKKVERVFKINIDSTKTNSFINWINNNGIILNNTFDGSSRAQSTTVNLKVIE